jgi:hypothetical protein
MVMTYDHFCPSFTFSTEVPRENLAYMMSWKKTLVAATFAILTLGEVGSHAADIEDEQWLVPQVTTPSYHGIALQNTGNEISQFSYLLATFNNANPNNFDRYVCKSTEDSDCKNADQYTYNSILPTCLESSQVDCVEAFIAVSSTGEEIPGKFSQYTTSSHPNNFQADPALGIPANANPGIWEIPGAAHAFGDKYTVNVSINGTIFRGNTNSQSLSALVTPVSVKTAGASRDQAKCESWLDPARGHYNNRCNNWITPQSANYKCSDVLGDYLGGAPDCLLPHAFPKNFKFKLSIRLKSEPVTWFHGRLVNPQIAIDKLATGIRLTVAAEPVKVPVAAHGDLWANLSQPLIDFWNKCENTYSVDFRCSGAGIHSTPLAQRTGTMLLPPYGNSALEAINVLATVTGDKAVAAPDSWTFNTLASGNNASACFTKGEGVKGIVTTNSTAYSAGPPVFEDQSLNYKVASLHYNPDGTVFKGTYNLVIRSDVARCLYSFSSAPVQASIQIVTDSAGASNVATTVASERNGWLYLNASNFTFSSPTIKVKLSQEAPAKADPAPTATAAPSAKKSTITCVKGKISKKVTAVKPVCPKGYKKK